jgi:hypothetical protein
MSLAGFNSKMIFGGHGNGQFQQGVIRKSKNNFRNIGRAGDSKIAAGRLIISICRPVNKNFSNIK